jgi:hypothetical protein
VDTFTWFSTKVPNIHIRENTVSSIISVGKTGGIKLALYLSQQIWQGYRGKGTLIHCW